MLLQVLVPAAIAVVVGAILLVAEYKTGFFATQARRVAEQQDQTTVQTTRLGLNIMRAGWIFGTLIFAVPFAIAITTLLLYTQVDRLQAQVRAYEEAEDWQLPEAIQQIGDASEELKLNLQDRQKLDELAVRVTEIEARNTEAEKELKTLRTENSLLRGQVESLRTQLSPSETVELTESQALPLVADDHYLGLKSAYDTYAAVTWANGDEFWDVGEQVAFTWEGQSCTITLVRTYPEEDRAVFALKCTPE